MRLDVFDYHQPRTLAEACALLTSLDGTTRVMAGGTDLLADLKQGRLGAEHVVAVGAIEELRRIERTDQGVSIGALATPNRIAASPEVRDVLPALCDAASVMGGNQIRNLATIGGNLSSAVPSADLPAPLLVGGASVDLRSASGNRGGQVEAFFVEPRRTAIRTGEILAAVHVPAPPPATGSAYVKFMLRDASALAVVGVAASVTLAGEVIERARIAITAAAPIPFLAVEAGWSLEGNPPEEGRLREAGRLAAEAARPISDLRGSAGYRRELVAVLTRRALAGALARIENPEAMPC